MSERAREPLFFEDVEEEVEAGTVHRERRQRQVPDGGWEWAEGQRR